MGQTTSELSVEHTGSQSATTPSTDQRILGMQDSGRSEEWINGDYIKSKTWQQRESKSYYRVLLLRSAVCIND